MKPAWINRDPWTIAHQLGKTGERRVRLMMGGINSQERLKQAVLDLTAESSLTNPVTTTGILEGTWAVGKPLWRRDIGERTSGGITYTLLLDLFENVDGDSVGGEASCFSDTTVDYFWDQPHEPEQPGPSEPGVSYRVGGVHKDRETGLWSWYLEKATSKVVDLVEYVSEETPTKTTKVSAKHNVRVSPEGALTDQGGNPVTVPEVGLSSYEKTVGEETVTVYTNTKQRRNKNRDCTTDIEIIMDELVAICNEFDCTDDYFTATHGLRCQNQPDKPDCEEYVLDPVTGVITEISSRLNEDNLYDIQTRTRTPHEREFPYTSEQRADRDTTTNHYRNQLLDDSSSEFKDELEKGLDYEGNGKSDAGTIRQISVRPNEHGRYDGDIRTVTAKKLETGEHVTVASHTRTAKTKHVQHAEDPVDDGVTLSAGVIHQASSRKNEFGLYDNTETTITADELKTEEHLSEENHFRLAKTTHIQNVPSGEEGDHLVEEGAEPTVLSKGTAVQSSKRRNEFGLLDVSDTIFESKQSAYDYSSETSAARSSRTYVGHNQDDPDTAEFLTPSPEHEQESAGSPMPLGTPAPEEENGGGEEPVDKVIVRVSSRKNEFGQYDNTKEVISPKSQATEYQAEYTAHSKTVATVKTNQPAKADATNETETGKITRARSQENEFGLFDTSTEEITAVTASSKCTSLEQDDRHSSQTVTRNNAGKPEATTASAGESGDALSEKGSGKVKRASSTKNEFGRYDTTEEIITAVPRRYQFIGSNTPFHYTKVTTEIHAEGVGKEVGAEGSNPPVTTEIHAEGVGKEVGTEGSNPPNPEKPYTSQSIRDEFGLYHNVIQELIPHENVKNLEGFTDNYFETQETEGTLNKDVPDDEDTTVCVTHGKGVIEEVNKRQNELGKWDETKVIRTAKPRYWVTKFHQESIQTPGVTQVISRYHFVNWGTNPTSNLGVPETSANLSAPTHVGHKDCSSDTASEVAIDIGENEFAVCDIKMNEYGLYNGTITVSEAPWKTPAHYKTDLFDSYVDFYSSYEHTHDLCSAGHFRVVRITRAVMHTKKVDDAYQFIRDNSPTKGDVYETSRGYLATALFQEFSNEIPLPKNEKEMVKINDLASQFGSPVGSLILRGSWTLPLDRVPVPGGQK